MQNDELRRAQEQIERSRSWYVELYENAPVGYLTFDEKGVVLDLNLTAADLLGIERTFPLKKPFSALIAPESQDTFYLHRQEVLRAPGIHTCELTLRRNKGAEQSFHAQIQSTAARSNGTVAIRTVLTDITERKHTHEELKKAKDSLQLQTEELRKAYDQLVLETTQRQQAEEQLRQTQKMEAIGTLAGGIAHDFNNMLAVIMGNAEMALDDAVDGRSEGSHQIEQILKASKRARDLVKQILTFSRKSEGQRRLLKVSLLVKETAKLLRGSLPSTIGIEVDIGTDSDTILADPTQIQQVLMNLSSNAAHAMSEEGTLTIDLSDTMFREGDPTPDRDMQPGRYAVLTVKDTGTGIPKNIRDKIFEPFFTTKEPGEGTGMGLSVVFGIVKSLGGAITVESKVGKGSAFTAFFPSSEPAVEEEPRRERALPTGNERVLVVDDEHSVVEIAFHVLKRLGYQVTTAGSGPEGWRKFEDNPYGFDLVITDHVMPEITGMRLAERMLAVRKDLPVILFTGYSPTVSPERAKEAGISEFLMKPVEKRRLAETVRRVLDTRVAR